MTEVRLDTKKAVVSADANLMEFQSTPSEKKEPTVLKTSGSLQFLQEDESSAEIESIFEDSYWSLFEEKSKCSPLTFSNGKTQEDVVKEIVGHIEGGRKIILLHGVCGTGKSAIALNIARALGSASVVVPVKGLQRQYEEEYMGKKYLMKKNGKKMKIAMITGRENHDSLIVPGASCADPSLPDTIKITEKNYETIKEYYKQNPLLSNDAVPPVKEIRRMAIAPSNPYWSPILPASIEAQYLKDAKKRRYKGVNGKEFVFYHRKPGCSYYDQYLAYMNADVVIFNSAKYLAELSMGRKPETEVEIIDEADEFLDGLSNSITINLTRLAASLRSVVPDAPEAKETLRRMTMLIDAEETNKRVLGIDEEQVYALHETRIEELLKLFLSDVELQAEITADELHYGNVAIEAAQTFKELFNDTYATFRKEEDNLIVTLVTTNLSQKFKEIVDSNKALVLMSGTLHDHTVLKNVFGIEDFVTVEAETMTQGAIDIVRVGGEFDCKFANFSSKKHSREEYLQLLDQIVEKAKRPTLVHVNAFIDLPTELEKVKLGLTNVMCQEELRSKQENDKTGKEISLFRSGGVDVLFTTKCSRGIDFPGETCNAIVFTKYPNANVKDTFWKILQKTHPQYFWDFYKDKAWRGFLQRLYRAIRSRNDHAFVLSPDTRILDSVRKLQTELF